MTPSQKILIQAFRALPARDRARLRYHAEKKTPILCGKDAGDWVKGDAG